MQDGPARIKNAITILKNGPGCSSRSSSPEDRFFVFRRSWDSRLSGIRSSMVDRTNRLPLLSQSSFRDIRT